jgi:hypothetical protein
VRDSCFGPVVAPGATNEGQRPWTNEMTLFLARMRRRGRSYRWIAKALGVPRAVCVERAAAAGLLQRSQPQQALVRTDEPEPLGPPGEILDDGVCHWVAGDVDGGVWRMCGHPSAGGTAWCAHHLSRVTRVPIERNMSPTGQRGSA